MMRSLLNSPAARMPDERPPLYGDGNASAKVAAALRASLARS